LKKLPLILSTVYWLITAAVLWIGYVGDEQIRAAAKGPQINSAAFDVFALFLVIAVAYAILFAAWWAVTRILRRPA
jgi:hypothetical protein